MADVCKSLGIRSSDIVFVCPADADTKCCSMFVIQLVVSFSSNISKDLSFLTRTYWHHCFSKFRTMGLVHTSHEYDCCGRWHGPSSFYSWRFNLKLCLANFFFKIDRRSFTIAQDRTLMYMRSPRHWQDDLIFINVGMAITVGALIS